MKVAFIGTNLGVIQKPWLLNGVGLMAHSGNNIGNLAFWYATDLLLDAEKICIPWSIKPDRVPKDVKALVIPAANFINARARLGDLANLVRALDLPCILIGIGAQAEKENAPPEIDSSVVEFLKEVAKRTPFIGLRGTFTKSMTDEFGILNTRVLGCPSILINPNPNLGQRLGERISKRVVDGPFAVHAACIKFPLMSVERELVKLVQTNPGSTFVVQRPVELIQRAYGEALNEQGLEYYAKCVEFFGFKGKEGRFDDFIRQTLYAPTSIDSWLHILQRHAAGLNTRIHGTLMGTAAGVPSICIVHDTRTRELAERLLVPRLEISDFVAVRYRVAEMFDRSRFNPKLFDQNRRDIASNYLELFRQSGLTPSPHLMNLAEAAKAAAE